MKPKVYINRSWVVANKYVEQTFKIALFKHYVMHYVTHLFIEMQSLYLVLTMLQINSSSLLRIIGYVTQHSSIVQTKIPVFLEIIFSLI